VDIPAHSGQASQGSNDVKIRVHTHEEPFIQEKIVAEVYVGKPSFVMSPTAATKRIDPGNLLFRPPGVTGPEPLADVTGGTLTFPWTPASGASTDVDGPGHRCLVVRAFPQNVTPPTTPFDVPNEGHEAQHNIEVLSTTKQQADMANGGAGTPGDPRRRDGNDGLWWEEFVTTAAGDAGTRFIVFAFDPNPSGELVDGITRVLAKAGWKEFSESPPDHVSLVGTKVDEIEPRRLLRNVAFVEQSGLGSGLFAKGRLLGAAKLELDPDRTAKLVLRFNHSDLRRGSAVVLHGAQWDEHGRPEGGMTVVAMAPSP
jgi:hypothetical protein